MGGVFSEFHYYDAKPVGPNVVQFWDTAYLAAERADYSASTTWVLTADGYLDFLSAYKEKLEFPELTQAMKALADREHVKHLLIENKASGQSAVQVLRRTVGCHVTAVDYKRGKDKEARAHAASPYVANGRVRFPRYNAQAEMLMREMRDFPNGEHDDLVDSAVGAILWAMAGRPLVKPHTRKTTWRV